MDNIKLLIKYSLLILRETSLQIILLLDLVGALTTYFTGIDVPSWILFCFPILGIFIAGFRIFQKSSPEIKVKLPIHDDIEFEFAGGHNDLTTDI